MIGFLLTGACTDDCFENRQLNQSKFSKLCSSCARSLKSRTWRTLKLKGNPVIFSTSPIVLCAKRGQDSFDHPCRRTQRPAIPAYPANKAS